MNVTIDGYSETGKCDHCGRLLRHCVHLSDGRIVGGTCFAKKMTEPRIYNGKKYRVDAQIIIGYAKAAMLPGNLAAMRGVGAAQLTFTLNAAGVAA